MMLTEDVPTLNDRLNAHMYNRDFGKFTMELNRLTLAKGGSLLDEHFNKYDIAQWVCDALMFDHSTLISLACAGLITHKGLPLVMNKLQAAGCSEHEQEEAMTQLEELSNWSDALHLLMEQPSRELSAPQVKAIAAQPYGVKDSDFILPLMATLYHIRSEDDMPDMSPDAQAALDSISERYFKGH